MVKIPYDASRDSLYKPGEADDFFRDGLDLSNQAVLCAEMARLAYVKDKTKLEKNLARAHFKLVSAIGYENTGTQAFIASSDESNAESILLIAFRGTERDDPRDLLSDADLRKTPWIIDESTKKSIGEVHNGFAKALTDGGEKSVLNQIKNAIRELDGKFSKILLTGHSLGAALATLTAADFKSVAWSTKVFLFTYGSPLVGDSQFANQTASINHQRFVNCCDLVTRMPPEALNFVHVGNLKYIDRHGKIIDSPSPELISEDASEATNDYIKKYASKIGTVKIRELADHCPINYLSGVSDTRSVSKFFNQICHEESKYVLARRNGNTPEEYKDPKPPSDLVGLAISGGGIRSATFALGVLEAFKNKNLLKKIDYLSTVSGGGYIGGWLSANCKRAKERNESSWLNSDGNWNESIKYLRRYSNYLSPNLSLLSADTWSMVTIWLRNTVLLQLMIVMAIASLLLLPRFGEATIQFGAKSWLHWAIAVLFSILIYSVAGNLRQIKISEETGEQNDNSILEKINRAIAKLFTPLAFNQAQIQFLVIFLMLISLGFSAILWQSAGNIVTESIKTGVTPGFLACLKYLCTHLESFQWFLLVPYLSMLVLSACSSQNRIISVLVAIPPTIVLYLLFSFTLYWLCDWNTAEWKDKGGSFLAFTWAPPMVLVALSLAINVLIGMQGNGSFEYVREWWSRFGAWLAIYGMAWMLVVVIAFYGPLGAELLYYEGWWKSLSSGWAGTVLAGLLAGKSPSTNGEARDGLATQAKSILAKAAPFVFIAGLFIIVSTGLHLVITNADENFSVDRCNLIGPVQSNQELNLMCTSDVSNSDSLKYYRHWQLLAIGQTQQLFGLPTIPIILLICLCCLILLTWRIDINEFSLNAFYRNRLARCYLGASRKSTERKPHEFTGFDRKDDMKLAELVKEGEIPTGPFHIVNCALNLGGSSDLEMHTRHSAVFTLTPLHCGSHYEVKKPSGKVIKEIGYVKTSEYCGYLPPTLGQAISVSGAAASPNMGYHTSAPVAFLMTLFNARLGWWFPNPFNSDCQASSPGNSFGFLLRELFGVADEKSEYLAISDGGHFENLAAYELIKRKCRVVIISDGECDPKLQCEGLANLIRICNVDLGATIKIDIEKITPKKASGRLNNQYHIEPADDFDWSEKRCAIGTITYKPDDHSNSEYGWLIYLKASMTGEEGKDGGTAVMQYKNTHPDFPHETTGDQFYAEDQFESYRWLGSDIAEELLALLQTPENANLKTILHQ